MIQRFVSWLRQTSPRRKPSGFDAVLAEEQERYAQLRNGVLQLLFVQAKLNAEVGGRNVELQRRIHLLTDEMMRSREQLAELRRTQLCAVAEIAFLNAV